MLDETSLSSDYILGYYISVHYF